MKNQLIFISIILTSCMQYEPVENQDANLNVLTITNTSKGETVYNASTIRNFGDYAGADKIWGTEDDDVAQSLNFKFKDEDYFVIQFKHVDSLNHFYYTPNLVQSYFQNMAQTIRKSEIYSNTSNFESVAWQKLENGERTLLFSAWNMLEASNYEQFAYSYIDRIKQSETLVTSYYYNNKGEDEIWFTDDDKIKFILVEDTLNKTAIYFDSPGTDGIWQTADDTIYFTAKNFRNINQLYNFNNPGIYYSYSTPKYQIEDRNLEDFFSYHETEKYTIEVRNRYIKLSTKSEPEFLQRSIMIFDKDSGFLPWRNQSLSVYTVSERYADSRKLVYPEPMTSIVHKITDDKILIQNSHVNLINCEVIDTEADLECILDAIETSKLPQWGNYIQQEFTKTASDTVEYVRISYSNEYPNGEFKVDDTQKLIIIDRRN